MGRVVAQRRLLPWASYRVLPRFRYVCGRAARGTQVSTCPATAGDGGVPARQRGGALGRQLDRQRLPCHPGFELPRGGPPIDACRTHLSLGKDAPEPRKVEPPETGEVVELPVVGGLHHRYSRRAA